jgi:thioredoxin 1
MAQLNSLLNVCVIAAVIIAAVFWVGAPAEPKPLPSDAHFVTQIQQPGTVLVKFGAEWCPPCRKIEEELNALARTESGHVSVVKIDIDQHRDLAAHYQVSSIPHLILFQNGHQVGEARGYRSRDELKAWISRTK